MKTIHKIYNLSFLIVVMCIILCSCTKAPSPVERQAISASKESLVNSTESTPESNNPHSVSEVVSQYSDLYHTEHVYQDQYIKQKYLLIGNKYVVESFVVKGVNFILFPTFLPLFFYLFKVHIISPPKFLKP